MPPEARWQHLNGQHRETTIRQLIRSTQIPVGLLEKDKNVDAKRGFRDRLGFEIERALAA